MVCDSNLSIFLMLLLFLFSDDIKKVTQIATSLVTVYGMNDKLGLVSYQGENEFMKPYSEETAAEIDFEVKNIVDQCYN